MTRSKTAFTEAQTSLPPEWDLSAFYSGPHDPRIEHDLAAARTHAEAFAKSYKGRVTTLTPTRFAKALVRYDQSIALTNLPASYASLLKAKNAMLHAKFVSRVEEEANSIRRLSLFFENEITKIGVKEYAALQKHSALARYKTWLGAARNAQPHTLTEGEENIIALKNMTGIDAWKKLFTQTLSTTEYAFEGQKLTQTEILKIYFEAPDRARREAAYDVFSKTIANIAPLATFILNTIALDMAENDKLRKYPNMVTARNLSNNIEDDVVDALSQAVVASYPQTSHRYYELKRRMLGMETLTPFDRLSPITAQDNVKTDFATTRDFIVATYRAFAPEMGDVAQEIFDNNWIDARVTPGRRGGAFAEPTVVARHPVMFMTWTNTPSNVNTLAHEIGHNIHQRLSALAQKSELLADTPLTLAETASVFGERLVFEASLARETDPSIRASLLANAIEASLSTVPRQIAFFDFEKAVHGKRRTEGELSTADINALWMQTQQDSLGPAFTLDERYQSHWAYIGHFFRSPFYVYAYAFGECLVTSLYETYEATPEAERPAFAEKYMDLLRAGGSKHHVEALAPFGIDLRDPSFWEKGPASLSRQIDRLEQELARIPGAKPQPNYAPFGPK